MVSDCWSRAISLRVSMPSFLRSSMRCWRAATCFSSLPVGFPPVARRRSIPGRLPQPIGRALPRFLDGADHLGVHADRQLFHQIRVLRLHDNSLIRLNKKLCMTMCYIWRHLMSIFTLIFIGLQPFGRFLTASPDATGMMPSPCPPPVDNSAGPGYPMTFPRRSLRPNSPTDPDRAPF